MHIIWEIFLFGKHKLPVMIMFANSYDRGTTFSWGETLKFEDFFFSFTYINQFSKKLGQNSRIDCIRAIKISLEHISHMAG